MSHHKKHHKKVRFVQVAPPVHSKVTEARESVMAKANPAIRADLGLFKSLATDTVVIAQKAYTGAITGYNASKPYVREASRMVVGTTSNVLVNTGMKLRETALKL